MLRKNMRPAVTGAMLGTAAAIYWLSAGCGHQVVQTSQASRIPAPLVVPREGQGTNSAALPANGLPNIPRVPAAAVMDVPDRSQSDVYHEVRSGESISGIARKYGRSTQAILEANGLDASAILRPKQLIYIP